MTNMYNNRKNLEEAYLLLKQNGFVPTSIIDVGVAKGTPELYSTFPDSKYLLIEPLVEFESYLKEILLNLEGSYVLSAADSFDGEATINVHSSHLSGSSLKEETMGEYADGQKRNINVYKIDTLLKTNKLEGPILLKVDVQGAELEVLEGSKNSLSLIEVIVLEVSMFKFMKNSPEFYDVIHYMKNIGFVAYDIIFGWNRPLDNALGQVDIVFVKENSFLRKSHAFSTQEQLEDIF